MRSVDNRLIELLDSWILLVVLDIGGEPILEIEIGGSLRASLEEFGDPENASNQVERPLRLAIVFGFQIVGILAVDVLHLLHQFVNFAENNIWANHQQSVHEPEALLLHIFVAILEPIDDSVHNVRLVESELLSHVLQENECCLSDWSSMILVVLEWS